MNDVRYRTLGYPALAGLLALMGIAFLGEMFLSRGLVDEQGRSSTFGSVDGFVCWAMGANAPRGVLYRLELERLMASVFLHGGILHLLMNALALNSLGRIAEPLVGTTRFLLIFLLSGLGAAIASGATRILSDEATLGSVGASGAVCGMIGLILGHLRGRTDPAASMVKRSLVMWGLLNLLFGFVEPRIDNAAHIGGFVVGYLSAWVLPVAGLAALAPSWQRRTIPLLTGVLVVFTAGSLVVAGIKARGRHDAILAYTTLHDRIGIIANTLAQEKPIKTSLRQSLATPSVFGKLRPYQEEMIKVLDMRPMGISAQLAAVAIRRQLVREVGVELIPDLHPELVRR